jgi:predicted MFS family arabinose efflux permease
MLCHGAGQVDPAAVMTMAVLGLPVGLCVVPQQHRVFTAVPRFASVAVGLNGSAIYIGSALGAGVGGIALAMGGSVAPAIAAALIGTLGVIVAANVLRAA